MKFLPGPETRAAVLRHPFFLAGLAVVALLGLTAGVLVLVDSARGKDASAPQVIVDQTTATIGPTAKTAEATGVRGAAREVTTVRSAPGLTAPILGTMPANAEVVIDGRTANSKWFRVIYPPRSELHGWIEADGLDVTGDPSTLAVATAEPPVVVEVPTTDLSRITPGPSTPSPTPALTATAAAELPDLVVGTTPVISGGKLFVTVINQGKGAAHGDIVVAVFNEDQTKLLGGTTLPNFTLEAGRSIDVDTGLAVVGSQKLLVIVNPTGAIDETNHLNNRTIIAVDASEPTATAPVPAATPPPVPPAQPSTP